MRKENAAQARHNLVFDIDDEQQKIAHEYLKKLGRKQSKKVAELICELISQNGVEDVTLISNKDAIELKLAKLALKPTDIQGMSKTFEQAMISAMQKTITPNSTEMKKIGENFSPSSTNTVLGNSSIDIEKNLKQSSLNDANASNNILSTAHIPSNEIHEDNDFDDDYNDEDDYNADDDFDSNEDTGINLDLFQSYT